MSKRLPKTLFVKPVTDGGVSYFTCDEDATTLVTIGEKVRVGVYQLVGKEEVSGTVVRRKVSK